MALTLQDDMDTIFLNSGWEESISYTPSGGVAKTIDAVVFREGSTDIPSGGRFGKLSSSQRRYDIEILISTDATNGIAAVIAHEDKVALKRTLGDIDSVTFVVGEVIESDAGAHRLGLR